MTDDTGRADWPAILRAANQDRTDRDAAQRALAQLHAWAGHRQPGAAREIRAWQDAVRIIAPIRGSVPAIVAQAQRESADVWAKAMHARHAAAGASCDPDYYGAPPRVCDVHAPYRRLRR